MKRILFLLLFLFVCGFAQKLSAQDTIYKTNRDIVVAKVLEVGSYDVKYKRYASPDGPTYIIRKAEIQKIVYADGTVENYTRIATPQASGKDMQRPLLVSINTFDLMLGMVTVNGEYDLGNSMASIRVPLSIGIGSLSSNILGRNELDGNYYNRDKIFSTGVNILFYPTGRHRIANYYLGVITEFGLVKRNGYQYNYPGPSTYYSYNETFMGAGLINGVQFVVSDRVNIGLDLALGMLSSDSSYVPLGRLGINMGWRFGKLPEAITVKK